MEQVGVGSYEPVARTYQSLGWPDRTSSHWGSNTSIPRIHPTKTLLLGTYTTKTGTCHRYNYQGALRSHSGKTCLSTCCRILFGRLDPHHTPKTHAKISPVVITMLLAQSALTTHKQSSTRHHITDIMRSREQVASSKRASILIAGVQG
jgi:hypothetical protein